MPFYRLLPTVRAYRVCRPSGTARALTSCSVSIARLLKLLGPFASSALAYFLAIQPPKWDDNAVRRPPSFVNASTNRRRQNAKAWEARSDQNRCSQNAQTPAQRRRVVGCILSPFFGTGITNFLENGGTLEVAQRIAGHADSRTTKLYDRRRQRVLLEDMERIRH